MLQEFLQRFHREFFHKLLSENLHGFFRVLNPESYRDYSRFGFSRGTSRDFPRNLFSNLYRDFIETSWRKLLKHRRENAYSAKGEYLQEFLEEFVEESPEDYFGSQVRIFGKKIRGTSGRLLEKKNPQNNS